LIVFYQSFPFLTFWALRILTLILPRVEIISDNRSHFHGGEFLEDQNPHNPQALKQPTNIAHEFEQAVRLPIYYFFLPVYMYVERDVFVGVRVLIHHAWL
jgi:hypothetical protein